MKKGVLLRTSCSSRLRTFSTLPFIKEKKMDVNILIQELEASWQWYHTAVVAVGAGLCVGGVLFLLYQALEAFFRE